MNKILKTQFLQSLACCTILLCSAVKSSADEARWYQIETVIFTHQSKDNNEHWYHHKPIDQEEHPLELITEEQWHALQALPDELLPADNEAELNTDTTDDDEDKLPAYIYLSDEQQTKLPYLLERLKKFKSYRVLFKGSWRQPLEEDDSLPIHVQGGENYNNMSELDGYLKLRVKRYLHITANLQFTLFSPVKKRKSIFVNPMQNIDFSQPDWAANQQWHPALYNPEFIPMENIILKQSRRMRSKELHYLDNPRLGLLVYITPYEIPLTESEENKTDTQTIIPN